MHLTVFVLMILFVCGAFADEGKKTFLFDEKELTSLDITEIVLENGMHVYLKPNDKDDNEVVLQFAAIGGYASFPESEQPAARIAADIVWESGFGPLTTDQLSALLYDHSVEFELAIKPFYRTIICEFRNDSFPVLLKLITDFFSKPQFKQSGLDEVLRTSSEILKHPEGIQTLKYENAFLALNTNEAFQNKSLSITDLEKVTLPKAKEAFEKLYCNPSEFSCVIVGDFNPEKIKPLLLLTLGNIQSKNTVLPLSTPSSTFPEQPLTKVISFKSGSDSLTRLTLPITTPIDEKTIYPLEMACQTIESHLRNVMQCRLKSSYGVDVDYEFPFYPSRRYPWMTVQFRSDFDQAEDLTKIIIAELKYLQKNGPNANDLNSILRSQRVTDEFWQYDDEYWLSFLVNSKLMGLNPEEVYKQRNLENINLQMIQNYISNLFDASKHTRLTTKQK